LYLNGFMRGLATPGGPFQGRGQRDLQPSAHVAVWSKPFMSRTATAMVKVCDRVGRWESMICDNPRPAGRRARRSQHLADRALVHALTLTLSLSASASWAFGQTGTIPASAIVSTPSFTGAVSRSQQSRNQETISIADFGASATASCATNTTAIMAALRAANSLGNAIVIIPPGVFQTHTITINAPFVGSLSPVTLTGPGTLQSCAAETLVQNATTHFGFRMHDINLDCNHIGTNGLLFTVDGAGSPSADNDVSGIQISNCTKRGLALDSTQNSRFSSIGLYGNKISLEFANGTGDILLSMVEAQLPPASVSGVFYGNDSELPSYAYQPSLGGTFITIERLQVECNGLNSCTIAPGPISINMANGNNNVIRDSLIDGSPIGGPELIYVNGSGNVFENNSYNTSYFDEKTFVNATGFAAAADNPNIVRGGTVYFGSSCTQPFLTTSGLFIVDRVIYGSAAQACMTFVDTSGNGISQTANFIPRSHSGAQFADPVFNPPLGTVGSFMFAPNGPRWWNNTAWEDVYGNAADGRGRNLHGSGPPQSGVGQTGDWYSDIASGAPYYRTTSGWVSIAYVQR
jgi:hypothetical protein